MATPHKCPTCNGTKKAVDSRLRAEVDCPTCGATGVVWEGPQEAAATAATYGPTDLTGS